jgi:hypothetical protein
MNIPWLSQSARALWFLPSRSAIVCATTGKRARNLSPVSDTVGSVSASHDKTAHCGSHICLVAAEYCNCYLSIAISSHGGLTYKQAPGR